MNPEERQQSRDMVAATDKRVATLRAQAALKGWTMHVTAPGPELMFCAYGRTRSLQLEEAEAFVHSLPALRCEGL